MKRVSLGERAELAVVDYMAARGFSILGRNVRLGALELDIVAQKGTVCAVVEVRTRGKTSYERPFESLTRTKRANLKRAVARLWRERLEGRIGIDRVRLDVAAVSFEEGVTTVEYVEGAL